MQLNCSMCNRHLVNIGLDDTKPLPDPIKIFADCPCGDRSYKKEITCQFCVLEGPLLVMDIQMNDNQVRLITKRGI